jgi:hypothetical protein
MLRLVHDSHRSVVKAVVVDGHAHAPELAVVLSVTGAIARKVQRDLPTTQE